MALEQWRAGGRTWIHRAFWIFHRIDGPRREADGAVLCLHGYPRASADWRVIWPALTRSHRVVAADMIGFGFSDKPTGYLYSVHDQATLHENLLASLGVRRAASARSHRAQSRVADSASPAALPRRTSPRTHSLGRRLGGDFGAAGDDQRSGGIRLRTSRRRSLGGPASACRAGGARRHRPLSA